MPTCFERLRNCLEESQGKKGTREYVRVLLLLEDFTVKEVERGITQGLKSGLHNHEAIKHLILHSKESTPKPINIKDRPKLVNIKIQATSAAKYGELIPGRVA